MFRNILKRRILFCDPHGFYALRCRFPNQIHLSRKRQRLQLSHLRFSHRQ